MLAEQVDRDTVSGPEANDVPDPDSSLGDFKKSEEPERARDLQKYLQSNIQVVLELLRDRLDEQGVARVEKLVSSAPRNATTFLGEASRILYLTDQQHVADSYDLLVPLYNSWNAYRLNSKTPSVSALKQRPRTSRRRWPFLGRRIDFPLGVPASAITGSREWIRILAGSGYNVLTFKTVRSRFHAEFEAPNWVLLPELKKPLKVRANGVLNPIAAARPIAWGPLEAPTVSTANSFGVPSAEPQDWAEEVGLALQELHEGQILIVSVLGDHYRTADNEGSASERRSEVVADFVRVSRMAREAGAEAIELNVSCPNTLKVDPADGIRPPLCVDDPGLVAEIVSAVRRDLGSDVKLVLKLSYMPFQELRDIVASTAGLIDAYAGINTLQVPAVGDDGQSIFPGRNLAGLSGIAIRDYALEFVRSLVRIRLEMDAPFDIIGMGGATDPESFRALFQAGATVVQSATAVNSNLALARECVAQFGESLDSVAVPDDETLDVLGEKLVELLKTESKPLDSYSLATALPVPLPHIDAAIHRAVQESLIRPVRSRGDLTRYAVSAR